MDNYKSFSYSHYYHAKDKGTLEKGQFKLPDTPSVFSTINKSTPLIKDKRIYWCTQDSHIQCYEIQTWDKVWSKEYIPSSEGQDHNIKTTLFALHQNTLIIACFPYLVGLEMDTGKTAWKMQYPYSTSSTQFLISNNKLLVYALSTEFKKFFHLIDLSRNEIVAKKELLKRRPDFLLAQASLNDFIFGHKFKMLAAILEKYDTYELEKIWGKDYSQESVVYSNKKLEKACWKGKHMLYNNKVIVPTDGKKLLCIDYDTGGKNWEFQLSQNHSHSNGFDIQDETLYLVDDEEYIKLDVNTGRVKERLNKKREWEKAGLLYSTSNLCINGEVAALGSILERCYGLIDVNTGTPFWSHRTDFQFGKFTPVLLNSCLFVYSMMDGKIELFPIE